METGICFAVFVKKLTYIALGVIGIYDIGILLCIIK